MAYRDKEVGTAPAARAEELRWAEVAARSEAGSWKSRFEASRRKRQAAVEEAKRVRRAAKDALFLEAEVVRLTRLLREAGVDSRRRGTMMSLRMEVTRLRKAAPGAEVQAAENHRLRGPSRRHTIRGAAP